MNDDMLSALMAAIDRRAAEDTTCAIDGCDRPRRARGWCPAHHARWKRHGDPLGGGFPLGLPPDEAFSARVKQVGDCLLWQSSKTSDGYGFFHIGGRKVIAHRWAFEREYGPISPGMQIDHICHQEACVNVEHLRLATPGQNSRYRRGGNRGSSTGVRNVYPADGRYIVLIRKDGVLNNFGRYDSIEEAQRVAEARRDELFGEFAGPRAPRAGRNPYEPERPRRMRERDPAKWAPPAYRDREAERVVGRLSKKEKKS